VASSLAPRDSLRYLDAARHAQAVFERYRYDHLPRGMPSDAKPCDETIGRFCYWHSADDTTVAEPSSITRARDQLLRILDALSQRSRADDWIAGQRVRYLIEAGYDSTALVASRACWSAAWWCGVLRGFVLHAAERYAQAEIVFDSALAAMPADEQCRWTDISLIVSDEDRDRYKAWPCGSPERLAFEQRFWQLADPSYIIPGNDRRTEHFSRVLLAVLSATARNPYGLPWGDDLRELLIRYGTPLSYSTSWRPWTMEAAPLIGHEREPSYHFAAVGASTDVAHWDVYAEQARERYAPPYMDSLVTLDAQFGMFRRGDSAIVVAVYADTNHRSTTALGFTDVGGSGAVAQRDRGHATTTRDSTGHAAIARDTIAQDTTTRDTTAHAAPSHDSSATDSAHHAPHLDRPRNTQIRMVRAPWKGLVVGVETYDDKTRKAMRARRWLAPPVPGEHAPQVSTLFFFDGSDTSAVGSLREAIDRAMTTDRVGPSRTLGVYWEVYDDSATAVSLTVTRTDRGLFKWLSQTLRLSPHDSPLAIHWHDIPGAGGISYRSVVLDLHELPAGTYRVDLSVGPDEQHATMTSRDVVLR